MLQRRCCGGHVVPHGVFIASPTAWMVSSALSASSAEAMLLPTSDCIALLFDAKPIIVIECESIKQACQIDA
ncbi:hypothetical protein [Ralstonia solanacearum]|uniref:hypothetical protein n=1 Tax=Ralstonia solanacearum TaxID=305 RepID=UPI0018C250FF|nr:hypothetical protein [Ralstonia solanacearum]